MADNNQMKMDESMGTVKARTLTLEPEKEQTSSIFTEPEPTRAELTETWDDGADYAAGTINESMLSAEEKAQVEEFAGTVDISNEKQLEKSEKICSVSVRRSEALKRLPGRDFSVCSRKVRPRCSILSQNMKRQKPTFERLRRF